MILVMNYLHPRLDISAQLRWIRIVYLGEIVAPIGGTMMRIFFCAVVYYHPFLLSRWSVVVKLLPIRALSDKNVHVSFLFLDLVVVTLRLATGSHNQPASQPANQPHTSCKIIR